MPAGRIFISHIHEEDDVARATQRLVEEELNTAQYKACDVFRLADKWAVKAGEDWLARIRREITAASAVILLLSEDSVSRPWVNFEAGAAWMRDIPLICACYGKLSKGTLPKPYSAYNALDLQTDGYYLIQSIAGWLECPCPMPLPPELVGEDERILRRRDLYRDLKDAIATYGLI